MRTVRLPFAITIALFLLPSERVFVARAAANASSDVAVITAGDVTEDKLALSDLRKIVLGDKQFWASGKRITLLIRAPQAHERDVILKKVCQMSEAQFRQHWIAKVFRAEAPSGPKVVNSNQTSLELVSAIPGSIAFVDVTDMPKNQKKLKIDGREPGEKGYPLQ